MPPMTRAEEEIEAELAALWAAVSKLASSLMWRTGQKVDVPVPQEKDMPENYVVSDVVEGISVEAVTSVPRERV